MKTRLWKIILAILFVLVCQISAKSLWINDVNVIPAQPSDTDSITFKISGEFGHFPFSFMYDQFMQDGASLQLDLHFDGGGGGFHVVLPWVYSKEIQAIPSATYTLEVGVFDDYYGTVQDTYTVDFTVVPELGTLVILSFALPIFRIFSRKKR